ncbi:lytic transglycosylase domain-containing protein [Gordonia sp. (in: high G+C Gram-positive bacteria)]|uniref:lytic transglycosylase domain-containing protein n=1 Tax=Gordonia sp. (in: high G+C Gram-positive bacteria) TaxID=84139 RepID=UPI0039E2FDB5
MRVLTAGLGTTAISALVLGAASSSTIADGARPAARAGEAASVTQVAGIASITENTAAAAFAPPKAGDPMISPQFRLAFGIPNGPLGIPGVVLQAYKLAATRMATESPACKLPWYLLAGIGRIESGHAGNGNVDEYGNVRTQIHGPALDGTLAGNAVILDSQGNAARAMGPMQFIPSTWATWGSDANGDGKADPQNIFDSTYSAGRYLCAGVSDIMAGNNKVAAVYRYNHSMAYVTNVLSWAAAYSTGVMPTEGIPDMHATPVDNPKDAKDRRRGDRARKPGEAIDDPRAADDGRDVDTGDAAKTEKKVKPKKPDCFIVCLPPEFGGPKQAPAGPRAGQRERGARPAPDAARPQVQPGPTLPGVAR